MERTLELWIAERDQDQNVELVDKAREGDANAFDALFQRHKRFVFNICLGILGSGEDAADATQDAFIHAHGRLKGFRGGASFRTWLYRIAVNCAVDLARKRKRSGIAGLEAADSAWSGSENDRVWEAILELPPDMRAALVLFYFNDLSGKELAEALGCSSGAARVRLHRARKSFKQKYQEIAR